MKIGIVVCTNGLGHIARQSILAQNLLEKNYSVDIFAPLKSISRVAPKLLKNTIDFDSLTNANSWKNGTANDWIKKIGNLDSYDKVISDNLLDILDLRSDAIISATFLWHKSIKIENSLYSHQSLLLEKYQPRIIANKYFIQPYIETLPNVEKIGFVADANNLQSKKERHAKKTILLQVGNDNSISKTKLKEYLTKTINSENHVHNDFHKIYLEPACYDSRLPSTFQPAKFNEEMFSALDIIIGRPGLGIITKSFTHKIPFISISEKDNLEIKNNNNILKTKFNIHIQDCFCSSMEKAKNLTFKYKDIDLNGVNQFIQILEK